MHALAVLLFASQRPKKVIFSTGVVQHPTTGQPDLRGF